MNRKQLLFVAVVLALAVIPIVVWRSLEPNRLVADLCSETKNAPNGKVGKAESKSTEISQSAQNHGTSKPATNTVPTPPEKPLYQMAETKSSFDPVANAERKKSLPFQMFASGGTGKIADREGNIVLRSDSKNAIFRCDVSPDQKRILVYGGDATYDIITPSSGERVRLPQLPPGDNVLGFSWHWLDDQMLLGVSGKTIPFRDDQVGPEREEPIISRSVLYVYNLKERRLSEVELPPTLRTKTISVSFVDETGKVQLRPEGRDVSYTDASLGWFEVRPKK